MSTAADPLNLEALAVRLGALKSGTFPVVTGFDAFVDENVRIVDRRLGEDGFIAMPQIDDFGNWVKRAAGRSGMREYSLEERAPGGCALNLGDGVAALGLPVDAFIGVGDPELPVFRDLRGHFRSVQSLGMGPGRSFVLQFDDGKLILGNFEELRALTPDWLRPRLLASDFRSRCESAAGLVFTSWASYPHLTDCWRMMQAEVINGLKHRPDLFFDLADPVGRSEEELSAMLACLGDWSAIGPVTLSVNENEAEQLAGVLSLGTDYPDRSITGRAAALREGIGIERLVIHAVNRAASATSEGAFEAAGPYCAKPVKTVGAGDRFNAGCLTGILAGFSEPESLALGNATSGFFVRRGRSPNASELAAFLLEWRNERRSELAL